MAARYPRHYQSRSVRSGSRTSDRDRHPAPNPTPPPDDYVKTFEACAATASYFLYAQRNLILSLHHDTLSVDRRFDKHKDEVLLIAADNVSERGAGRLVVSYDASQTAIVWDLFTGEEVSRFASFETIKVAAWMRDGSIAFGGSMFGAIRFTNANGVQVTHKAPSSFSSRRPQSTSTRGQSSTPSLRLRLHLTVAPSRLGKWSLPVPRVRARRLTLSQLPERLHPHCDTATFLHNPPHTHNIKRPVANMWLSMAWFVVEAEDGHACDTDSRRRSACLVRLESPTSRRTSSHPSPRVYRAG